MSAKERVTSQANARLQALAIPLSVGGVLVIAVLAFMLVGIKPVEIDDKGCPLNSGPAGTTVLLLDTSDPFSPKHKETLESFFDNALDAYGAMSIAPEELLVVYQLSIDPGETNKLLEVCRPPKDLEDRTWRDDIYQGKKLAERDWSRFELELDKSTNLNRDHQELASSPILETISVLAARHAPGKQGDQSQKLHFMVFSDLLQHTPRLSHFGPYPAVEELSRRYRDLMADLTGVEVSLYRLERPKYQSFQGTDHYYWWTEYVKEAGGRLRFQDSY